MTVSIISHKSSGFIFIIYNMRHSRVCPVLGRGGPGAVRDCPASQTGARGASGRTERETLGCADLLQRRLQTSCCMYCRLTQLCSHLLQTGGHDIKAGGDFTLRQIAFSRHNLDQSLDSGDRPELHQQGHHEEHLDSLQWQGNLVSLTSRSRVLSRE